MLTHCPYCQSTQVHRIFVSHPYESTSHLQKTSSWASHMGLGGIVLNQLSKGSHLSPWMVGLAEVLIKGVYLYWVETQRSHFGTGIAIEFYCEQCHKAFSP